MYETKLIQRGRALENSFFVKKEIITISNLYEKQLIEKNLETLKKYTGIKDETVLRNAMEYGLSPTTFFAFIYFPIVYVAWTDDLLDNKEKKKIRLISKELGIFFHDDSVRQIEYWLQNPPGESAFRVWKTFFSEYKKSLKPVQLEKLVFQIKERAESVARSSGILPFIGDISKKEKLFLEKLDHILDEEIGDIFVADFMSREVKTVSEDETVEDVAKMMLKESISVVPVISNNQLIGILTESDFIGKNADIPHSLASIKSLFGQHYYFSEIEPLFEKAKGKKVSEVMTKNPIFVSPDCSLTEIVNLMSEKNLKRIPVVDNNKVVGIVTRRDIIRAFLMV